MRVFLLTCVWVCSSLWHLQAQGHVPVFPALSGQELVNTVRNQYKPLTVLTFAQARDTLFGRIYNHNDSLTCVYTGHTIYLNPAQDPTVAAYMDGGPNGINTEHTYPRSKGAETGNAQADMHHLYATRIDVNADRGDYPFAEVPDAQAERWYFLGQQMASVPGSNIEQYSELGNYVFEVREDHKGNVARAMFYFYTMYRAEADLADNAYFPDQRAFLCQWHALDPVDELEWSRTYQIATYQDGKPNPFVLDCTLAQRTYCPELAGQLCITTDIHEPGNKGRSLFLGAPQPNPAGADTRLSYQIEEGGHVRLEIWNDMGALVAVPVDENQGAGAYSLQMDTAPLGAAGLYRCRLMLSNSRGIQARSTSLVKTR